MHTAVALFSRDLRVHDLPALAAAVDEAARVVPLFVVDDGIVGHRGSNGRRGLDYNRPNRAAFLVESLTDLDASLRGLGAGLVVRRGDVVEETLRLALDVGAGAVHCSADVSRYAQRREARLSAACEEAGVAFTAHPGVTVVPPGAVTPTSGDHFKVFTPYHRRWQETTLRPVAPTPERLRLPDGLDRGRVPTADEVCRGDRSPDLVEGGETAGRRRLDAWFDEGVADYEDSHDDLAGDRTSRLSAYLHFGCLSPREILDRADGRRAEGSHGAAGESVAAFVRQLAWRDFHHQVLAARPDVVTEDYRTKGDHWHDDADALAAWQEGRTGIPVVDAGMRQLAREGWMHNRARLLVGNLLVKLLYVDWRHGARHFFDLLVDGDIANNTMNWQWVAGTGSDTRPNRTFNLTTQGRRHDPDGEYVRRYVPELAPAVDAAGGDVHEPWDLPTDLRRGLDYPEPIVDLGAARDRFLSARGAR